MHLIKCITSIISTKYSDYELLLIDDGSTDGSGQICDKFADQDTRVKVMHKENRGVSSARNLGLKYARGEWVAFVDSDDFVSENYFEILNKLPESDWIMTNAIKVNESSFEDYISYSEASLNRTSFLNTYSLHPNFYSPWGKFFKNDIIQSHKLRFDKDLYVGEDALFNIRYLKYVKQVYLYPPSVYYYRDRKSSLGKTALLFENQHFYYYKMKEDLKSLSHSHYLKIIESPLLRYILALFKDQSITDSLQKKELSRIVKEDYSALLNVYRRTRFLKYLIRLSKISGSEFLLRKALKKVIK